MDRESWLDEVSALGTICLVLETTESFSERLATEARERGLEVYVVSSGALHNFRRSEGFEDKRDDLDAYLLGLMGHRGIRSVKLAVVRTGEEERLRSLDRARTRLVRHRVSIGQQLRAVILRLSPDFFAEGWNGPKVMSATFQTVLARWPKLTSLGRTRLGTVVIGSRVPSLWLARRRFDPYEIHPSSDGPGPSNLFRPIPGQPATDRWVGMKGRKMPSRDRPPGKCHSHTESPAKPTPQRFDLVTTIFSGHRA